MDACRSHQQMCDSLDTRTRMPPFSQRERLCGDPTQILKWPYARFLSAGSIKNFSGLPVPFCIDLAVSKCLEQKIHHILSKKIT